MNYKIKSALPDSIVGKKIKQHTQDVYKENYNANVNPCPDEFIYLESGEEIYASFGITYRKNKKLFSECYLDTPLEKEIFAFGDLVTSEVGSFISTKKGFGLHLYKLLPYILYEKRSLYVLVTLTKKVQILFNRLSIHTTYLNDALEDRVPVKNIWGSFYESRPKTYVMNVQKSCRDIFLADYARKINTEINDVGKILEHEIIFNFHNLYLQKNIPVIAEQTLNLQTYNEGLQV